MTEVVWTDLAIRDLEGIKEYISQDSIKYAGLTVTKIINRADILIKHPLTGRTVPEKEDENIREIIEGNYRIVYKLVTNKLVHILTVYHGARDMRKAQL